MCDPVRLSKQSDTMRWEQRITPYVPYILLCLFIILTLLIFALVCVVMGVSVSSLTNTEANGYYYHLQELI